MEPTTLTCSSKLEEHSRKLRRSEWIEDEELINQICDVCGPYEVWRNSDGTIEIGKDPHHVIIMKTVNLCSLCFKKILVDFTACAKAYIESKNDK